MFNRRLIKALKNTINSLEEDLQNEKEKNSYLTNDCLVLLKNSSRDRNKIIDLENNIEFLVNNLSAKKRELVQPSNQN